MPFSMTGSWNRPVFDDERVKLQGMTSSVELAGEQVIALVTELFTLIADAQPRHKCASASNEESIPDNYATPGRLAVYYF
jgi:hypothetical protein